MKVLTALFACLGSAAFAACDTHASVMATLAEKYQETRQSIALMHNGSVIEIYAGENGTWSAIVTAPGGPSCLVAAGTGWQAVNEALPPQGDDM